MSVILLILGAVTVCGTSAAMSLRKPVHCVLALALGLIGIAGLYLSLGAEFVGFTQIMVYVGAVAILAVFAIMTTQQSDDDLTPHKSLRGRWSTISGIATALGVLAVLTRIILSSGVGNRATAPAPELTVNRIGVALMNGFAWPLEVVGLLLTVAMVGAVIVAMPDKRRRG
jgi:NADH-quinone oxidoreductase subunit J